MCVVHSPGQRALTCVSSFGQESKGLEKQSARAPRHPLASDHIAAILRPVVVAGADVLRIALLEIDGQWYQHLRIFGTDRHVVSHKVPFVLLVPPPIKGPEE